MTGLARRGLPVGRVRTGIEVTVLVVGWLLDRVRGWRWMYLLMPIAFLAIVLSRIAAMGSVQPGVYLPDDKSAEAYDALYAQYAKLHDYFGRGGNDVMHELRRIRREACA